MYIDKYDIVCIWRDAYGDAMIAHKKKRKNITAVNHGCTAVNHVLQCYSLYMWFTTVNHYNLPWQITNLPR